MTVGTFVSIRNKGRKTTGSLTRISNKRLFNKAGFSLLEFTIALSIVGILVSILIPKLNNLQDDVHKANVQLTASSLQYAVNLTHSLWQSQGSMNQTTLLKGFGYGNILMGSKGWPVDAIDLNHRDLTESTTDFVLNSSTCKRLWNGLLKNTAPKIKVSTGSEGKSTERKKNEANDIDFIYLTDFNQGVCTFRYLLVNNGSRIEYDLATGRVITLFL
jgi:prepilin-type N-terminal cleavage/methylation domain-containing protein